MRPILRPGTHVLQRADGCLQVGLDPAGALVLPDTDIVRSGLRLVTSLGGITPTAGTTTGAARASKAADTTEAAAAAGEATDPTVDLLAAHDLLVDERDLKPLLAGDLPATAGAALARSAGTATRSARRAREEFRFVVRTFGHPGGHDLHARLTSLTRAAGLREAAPRRVQAPDCGVLLGVGEPDRDLLDEWTRAGTPYLLVRLTEGRAVVGPFAVPGRTACLRCLDAHCTDADPSWPLLVRQYAARSARDRADGVPEPVDPLLSALALAWAARDLASYVDGARPSSWSATVGVEARLARIETRGWLRHPSCGCSWQ